MSERPGYDFRGRQISPAIRADWRHDARPTNHDDARVAVLNRRITALLDALYEAEASLAQAWADGYNHARVELLSATVEEDDDRLTNPPDSLGWWSISGEEFLRALRLVAEGNDPEMVYAEFYANSETGRP